MEVGIGSPEICSSCSTDWTIVSIIGPSLSGKQFAAVMPFYFYSENCAGRRGICKPHRQKMLGARHLHSLGEQHAVSANFVFKTIAQRSFAFFAQPSRAIFDDLTRGLRHARGRRARPRRK